MTVAAAGLDTVSASSARVVTAADAGAATVGAAALLAGGNAFDAVLAACFMETVTLPMKCGLAGDVVAVIRPAGESASALVSVGPAPAALATGARLARVGPCSVGVPGAPQGYAALHAYARLDLASLIAPAVRAAERGVRWTALAHGYLCEASGLLAIQSPDNPYWLDGTVPQIGDVRRLPGLGRLLVAFARSGGALFHGEEGARLVAAVKARGGFLTHEDLRQPTARRCQVEMHELGLNDKLSVTPPPTQGPLLADAVARTVLCREGVCDAVLAVRSNARQTGRQAHDAGTSVVACADDEGNFAVVLHSNSFPQFGSGIVLDDGLILNNRPGRGFDLEAPAGAVNAPAPGKIPPTTLHAWMLEHRGATFVGATPGGVNQLAWNAQTITALISGSTPVEVVTAPRWAMDAEGAIRAEPGASTGARRVAEVPAFSLRSVQQVIQLDRHGLHLAAADPRAGGVALPVH